MADSKGDAPSKPTKRSRSKAKRTKSPAAESSSEKGSEASEPTEKVGSRGAGSELEALQHKLERIHLGYVRQLQEGQTRIRRDLTEATQEYYGTLTERYRAVAEEQNKAYRAYLEALGALSSEDHTDGRLGESAEAYHAALQQMAGAHPEQREALEDLYQEFLEGLESAAEGENPQSASEDVHRDFLNRLDAELRKADAHAKAAEASRSYFQALESQHTELHRASARALEEYSDSVAASWTDDDGVERLTEASKSFESANDSAWKELRELYRTAAEDATSATRAALEEYRHATSG